MKEAAQSSTAPVSSQSPGSGNAAAAAAAAAGGGTSSLATLDHLCCHQHHVNPQHRQHVVQQKLQQLHQQIQQAAGHSAIDSLQQVTTIACHLKFKVYSSYIIPLTKNNIDQQVAIKW